MKITNFFCKVRFGILIGETLPALVKETEYYIDVMTRLGHTVSLFFNYELLLQIYSKAQQLSLCQFDKTYLLIYREGLGKIMDKTVSTPDRYENVVDEDLEASDAHMRALYFR